jgi:hypothetical protein
MGMGVAVGSSVWMLNAHSGKVWCAVSGEAGENTRVIKRHEPKGGGEAALGLRGGVLQGYDRLLGRFCLSELSNLSMCIVFNSIK